MTYLATLSLRPGSDDVRRAKRVEHLKFLIANRDRILYGGGLVADDEVTVTGLIMVLDLPSRGETEAFVKSEPYVAAGIFDRIVIERLVQRVPEPEAGFFERLLEMESRT